MIYRKFGNTGVEISALGFGCMRLPENEVDGVWEVDQEKATEMLMYAYENGVNYFDTAFFYCHSNSEIAVGKALKPIRDKVYISTKCPMDKINSKEDYRNQLQRSLDKMDTDYVDFYHFWGINKGVFDDKIMKLGLVEEALKLKEEGKIRHISFSFHDEPKNIKHIVDNAPEIETMLIQYNLLDRSNEEWIEYVAKKGLGVLAMGPVAGGRLAAPKEINQRLGVDEKIAGYDLAIRFVLDNENISCALSGMQSLEMVKQNLNVVKGSLKLSDEDKQTIERTRNLVNKFNELYCTGCAYCQPCPKGIHIPDLFEAFTMHNVYGLDENAKAKFQEYKSKGSTASSCVNCEFCEKKCPQKLKVRELFEKAESTLIAL